jgi:hypothetical protein
MNYNDKGFAIGYFRQVPVRPRQYEQPPIWKHYKAVVSRGGRPDLALSSTSSNSTTLLLVGGMDVPVIGMNKMAFDELHSVKEMKLFLEQHIF